MTVRTCVLRECTLDTARLSLGSLTHCGKQSACYHFRREGYSGKTLIYLHIWYRRKRNLEHYNISKICKNPLWGKYLCANNESRFKKILTTNRKRNSYLSTLRYVYDLS